MITADVPGRRNAVDFLVARPVDRPLMSPKITAPEAAAGPLIDAARRALTAGQAIEACDHYEQALAIWSTDAGTWADYGAACRYAGRNTQGQQAFVRALQIDPQCVAALTNLAILLDESGALDPALDCYRQALAIQPTTELRLLEATVLPPVFQSTADIKRWRGRLTQRLTALEADGVRYDLTHWPSTMLFYLAYQGQNDRALHEQFARLHSAPQEPLPHRPKRSRPRIGFVSRHLREHTIGHLFSRGILLLAEQFDVVVGAIGGGDDQVTQRLRQRVATYVDLPLELSTTRSLLAAQDLDLVVYTDLGMEPWSLALAHTRLAPVQCVTWGHPVTSGLPTIDYFLSTVDLDLPESQAHYTEQLVRLPTLPCYYERPANVGPPLSRAELGLPAEARLYGCLQTLFKFHPEFDPLLAGILERDPTGVVTLVAGTNRVWPEQLLARFRRTLGPLAERVRVLTTVPRERYFQLLAAHDVLLDPLHFGGGNTSYEGLAMLVPIITWPGPLLRSRITAALYAQLGLPDAVVASGPEYVDQAVRLATDRAYRAGFQARLGERVGRLFDDRSGVDAWADFFRLAIARHSSSAAALSTIVESRAVE